MTTILMECEKLSHKITVIFFKQTANYCLEGQGNPYEETNRSYRDQYSKKYVQHTQHLSSSAFLQNIY